MDDISIKLYPNPVSDVLYLEILNQQNLNPFDLLIHDKFGKGEVISMEGEAPNIKATVTFQGAGNKQLLLKFAKLRIVGKARQ